MSDEPVRYVIEITLDNSWVDLREARPRARARLKNGVTAPQTIDIDIEGALTFDASKVDVDTYQGAKYEAVRTENGEYWKARDQRKKDRDAKKSKEK